MICHNVGRTSGNSQLPSPVITPSNQQGALSQAAPATSKPNSEKQGAPKIGNTSTISKTTDSLSKIESEFIKSLKSQSLRGGPSDIESGKVSIIYIPLCMGVIWHLLY